jgi:hypothetical protein
MAMTYLLKLRAEGSIPAVTITIASTSAQEESPCRWKAHLQYDDSSRQATAEFETAPRTPMCAIFSTAFHALDLAYGPQKTYTTAEV